MTPLQPNNPWIPADHFLRLKSSHAEGCNILKQECVVDDEMECGEVAEFVEAHRWAWKPEKVRLILLAESHVFTQKSELEILIPQSTDIPANLPSNYVRLVYCLGYGEQNLSGLKGGTPQFWSIFGTLAETTPKNVPGADSRFRLREKIRTLQILQERGVWLLDASLHAVSLRYSNRLGPRVTTRLHHSWWHDYGAGMIRECRPEKIVAIGKAVYEEMSGLVGISDWIYQPQGVRSEAQSVYNASKLRGLRDWMKNQ